MKRPVTMRDETRRNLNRAIWRDRGKKAGIGLVILAAIGLYMFYESYDLAVTTTDVTGIIETIEPLVAKGNAAGEGLTVGVKLDHGGHAHVNALKSRDPHVGEKITIVEHRHGTGRVTHTMK